MEIAYNELQDEQTRRQSLKDENKETTRLVNEGPIVRPRDPSVCMRPNSVPLCV